MDIYGGKGIDRRNQEGSNEEMVMGKWRLGKGVNSEWTRSVLTSTLETLIQLV